MSGKILNFLCKPPKVSLKPDVHSSKIKIKLCFFFKCFIASRKSLVGGLLLNISILISVIKKEVFNLNEIAIIALYLLLFIFGQSITQLIIAWTFNFVKLINSYLKQKIILANGFLISIFVINISLTYTQDYLHVFFFLSLICITSYIIFSFLKILSKHKKIISENLFYFILYLCTLEIIPLFFFYKLLMDEIQI